MATTEEKEAILYADLGELRAKIRRKLETKCSADPGVTESTRAGIPIYSQRRFDVYKDIGERV